MDTCKNKPLPIFGEWLVLFILNWVRGSTKAFVNGKEIAYSSGAGVDVTVKKRYPVATGSTIRTGDVVDIIDGTVSRSAVGIAPVSIDIGEESYTTMPTISAANDQIIHLKNNIYAMTHVVMTSSNSSKQYQLIIFELDGSVVRASKSYNLDTVSYNKSMDIYLLKISDTSFLAISDQTSNSGYITAKQFTLPNPTGIYYTVRTIPMHSYASRNVRCASNDTKFILFETHPYSSDEVGYLALFDQLTGSELSTWDSPYNIDYRINTANQGHDAIHFLPWLKDDTHEYFAIICTSGSDGVIVSIFSIEFSTNKIALLRQRRLMDYVDIGSTLNIKSSFVTKDRICIIYLESNIYKVAIINPQVSGEITAVISDNLALFDNEYLSTRLAHHATDTDVHLFSGYTTSSDKLYVERLVIQGDVISRSTDLAVFDNTYTKIYGSDWINDDELIFLWRSTTSSGGKHNSKVVKIAQFGNQLSGAFVYPCSDAIALSDGNSNDEVDVILNGITEIDGYPKDSDIISQDVCGYTILDNIMIVGRRSGWKKMAQFDFSGVNGGFEIPLTYRVIDLSEYIIYIQNLSSSAGAYLTFDTLNLSMWSSDDGYTPAYQYVYAIHMPFTMDGLVGRSTYYNSDNHTSSQDSSFGFAYKSFLDISTLTGSTPYVLTSGEFIMYGKM